jgi:hypothetical protein
MRFGLQGSNLHFNKEPDAFSKKVTYLIPGFYFEQELSEKTAISLDIQYASKGFYANQLRYTLPYITSPLLFHYKPSSNFSLFAGPEIGLKLLTSYVENDERIKEESIFTKRLDLGISGGFSYQLTKGYSLMLRYTHGLSNVLGKDIVLLDANDKEIEEAKFTNRTLQLSLSSQVSISHEEKKTKMYYGIRQGITAFTIYGSGVEVVGGNNAVLKKRIGFETGLELRFIFQKYFFLTTGLNFQQKGGQINGDNPVELNYFSIPVIIGVSPIKTDFFTLSLEGGIGFERQVKSQNPYYFPNNPDATEHIDAASYMHGFEISTDAIKRLTLFLSYRKWSDARFLELDTRNNELLTKGETFSAGIRFRPEKKIQSKSEDSDVAVYDNVSAIGLKGGFNINRAVYENQPAYFDNNSSLELGAHVGIYFKIRLSKRFAFTPELQYTKKQSHLTAIENPFILSYAFKNRFTFETGPQWGLILNSNLKILPAYDEYVTITDLGMNAGLRYRISQKVSITARYYHGLKDIYGWIGKDGVSIPVNGYNRNLQISTYYKLSRNH